MRKVRLHAPGEIPAPFRALAQRLGRSLAELPVCSFAAAGAFHAYPLLMAR